MSEERGKYELSFDGSAQLKDYMRMLYGYLTIGVPAIEKHIDIAFDYAKHLPTVTALREERKGISDEEIQHNRVSLEIYNESISAMIQKAERLIAKLENLQKAESKYPQKIISGGQTGADRAGLDAGLEAGLPVGGYVPRGRLSEDGQVPDKYPMTETGSKDYKSRTKRNILESDGTLIINIGPMKGGTALTAKIAQENNRPLMIVQLDDDYQVGAVINWLEENRIQTLNIAGPRESKLPGIHDKAKQFLKEVLTQ